MWTSSLVLLGLWACKDGGDTDTGDTAVEQPQDSALCSNPGTWWPDVDGDGFGALEGAVVACEAPHRHAAKTGDCDDSDWQVSPDAPETCDGRDNNCDGVVDNDATDATDWYQDADGDGYGSGAALAGCTSPFPSGTSSDGDCDDGDAAIHPGAPETDCTDPVDYNCDGSVGYGDDDGDGFPACKDCDDSNAAVSPAGSEVCDDMDNDCDGVIDGSSALDVQTFYADTDGDGYGDSGLSQQACEPSEGWVLNASDCDDSQSSINPSASEVCDGSTDEDCDGDIDEPSASDAPTWNIDVDGDGYGSATYTTRQCTQPSGYVSDATDCDDADASIHPSADELCGGDDEDCDGSVDESGAIDASTWYADTDGDGYGDASSSTVACTVSSGWVSDTTDCDDGDDSVNPGADEVCDGQDNDCDGDSDHGAVWVGTDYSSIQDAIDDAKDGDLICIAAGTWSENLDFGGKSCTLEGDARGLTAIDGSASGIVVQATQGEDIGLRNLTLQNGAAASGPGLYIEDSTATLEDVAFDDMDCSGHTRCEGGALYCEDGSVDAVGLSFTDIDASSTTTLGGAVLGDDATIELSDVSVDGVDCTATDCDGVFAMGIDGEITLEQVVATNLSATVSSKLDGSFWYGSRAELHASDIELYGNSYTGDATGMFHNQYGTMELESVHIHDNTWAPFDAMYGLAAYDSTWSSDWTEAMQADGLQVRDNQVSFSSNGLAAGALGIWSHGGNYRVTTRPTQIHNAEFTGNTLDGVVLTKGTLFWWGGGASLEIQNVIAADNSVTAGSGTTHNYGLLGCESVGELRMENTDLLYNSADTFTYLYAGLLMAGEECDLEVVNTNVVGNESPGSTEYGALFYSSYSYGHSDVGSLSFRYNNVYDNGFSGSELYWSDGTTSSVDSSNLSTDPLYSDTSSSDATDWDLSLDSSSPLIDAGSPAIMDADGSTSDIGAHGGEHSAL